MRHATFVFGMLDIADFAIAPSPRETKFHAMEFCVINYAETVFHPYDL